MIRRSRFVPRLGAAFALFALLACSGARAQTDELPDPVQPHGLEWGPVYVLPSLGVSVSEETNPFYQPESDADTISRANPVFELLVPFSHSYFRVNYDAVFRHYATTEVEDTTSQEYLGELSLQFATGDRLVLGYDKSTGASEVIRFDGGETTYDGTPYNFAVYTAGVERTTPGHFGYHAVANGRRLTFGETDFNFFEYAGYDLTADADIPVSASVWFVTGAGVRRYDHFNTQDPPGQVFRKEVANILRAGVRGVLASGRYHAIVGYEAATYPGGSGSDFNGVIGDGSFDWQLGPMTTLSFFASRRPWSSFYGDSNYYVAGTAGGSFTHAWITGHQAGANVVFTRTRYPDEVTTAGVTQLRHDRGLQADTYFVVALHPQCALRFAYQVQIRNSNVSGFDYTAQSLGMQLVMGWR